MRSRNSLVLVGLTAICLAALFFVGCSDDDGVTRGNSGPDLYQVAQDQSNESLETTVEYLDDVLNTIHLVLADLEDEVLDDTLILQHLGPLPQDSSDTPTDEARWWVRYSSDLQAGVSSSMVDSIRWLNGIVPVARPRDADGVDFRRHYSVTAADTTVTYENLDVTASLTFTGIDGSTAIVSGAISFDIQSRHVQADSMAWESYVTGVEIPGVTVVKNGDYWDQGCPSSGTCQISMEQTFKQNAGTEQEVAWTFDVTFAQGVASADVSNDAGLSASYQAVICTMQ